MQTRLDLPPAPKQALIATQKPANSLMKYLRIRKGDLPYAAGVAAGVIYLTLNDAFFVFVLASFALVFGAMYYCAKVIATVLEAIKSKQSVQNGG